MNFWVHHWFQQECGWSKTHYHFRGLNSLGFWTHLQRESEVGKPEASSLLHTATMGQPGHQCFSLAEVQPYQAPREDSCPGDVHWTELACHVNTCRETWHAKNLSRDFAREMLCNDCFVVIIKDGKGMSLLFYWPLSLVLSSAKYVRLTVKQKIWGDGGLCSLKHNNPL